MKSKLISALLHSLLFLIRLIPKAVVGPLAFTLGGLAPALLKRDRALIVSNIRRVYGLPGHSNFSRAFQKQVFRSQFAVALETIKDQLAEKSLIHLHGCEEAGAAIQNLLNQGRGLIFVTAHLGSWEMVASSVAQMSGRTFNALAKPSKLPEFTTILESLRGRGNIRVLWTDRKSILKDMIQVLRNGESLGFVMDQKPEGRIGPEVDFLGQKTEFVSGPAKLAIRHRSPVVSIFCIRTGPWEYRIKVETLVDDAHDDFDELALTQRMASAIEQIIRLYPEQWIWNYKRWRNQTTGASS